MHLVARVFDLDITEEEVLGESRELIGQETSLAQIHALNRLIDRCLLLHEALVSGVSATEEEFDSALLETLEEMDIAPLNAMQTRAMEERIRRRIIIRKYVQQVCAKDILIADDKLFAFYEDQKEVLFASEIIHASHILIQASEPEAEQKAKELRARIKDAEDFWSLCKDHSQCPSGCRLGDLGWFPRGRMIKEIEDVAFSLKPGQVSEVFRSRYGYHILMVTDKKIQQSVPFEDIRDSLKSHLIQLEREFFLIRHLNQLRENYRDQIQILDENYNS
ncbi:MAG: peptidylprolyl isomerase [Candidatus Syntrophosphaera sp.]|nr:peptidylprolyl isomerase [Candidatus Syntrophosphaera sp.]